MALTQALAQEPGSAAATLDTVMVTANKRVENVQEVPKQIMVVTPEILSRQGVTTMAELGNAIPSIGGSVPTEQRASAPPIRGISSFSISIGVQTQTGIVIDDVPQASYSSLFKELTDIQSVEVLAGPQSTLSGRNASGGLINVVTRTPSDIFEAEVSMEHTSDRQERFSAFLSGPLSDTLAFSLSAFSNEWEGPYRSLSESNGSRPLHVGGWDTQGARGKLRWQPNERLTATMIGWWMESTSAGVDPVADAYLAIDPAASHQFDTGGRSFGQIYPDVNLKRHNRYLVSDRHSTFNTKDRGGSLKVEYDLPNASTITSITSVARADLPREVNQLTIPFDQLINPNITSVWAEAGYETQTKTQEFRLTSPGEQLFDYVLGLSWSDTDTWHPYHRPGIFPVYFIRTFDIESLALFGRGTWNVGERDALTAGLRYQRDDMGYSFASVLVPPNGTIEPFLAQDRNKYDFLSGELSWRHQFADNVNGYVTVSKAQSGEVYDLEDFGGAQGGGLQPLASQKVENLEMGFKSQFLDRRLTLNINAFLARYDNFHVQYTQAPTSINDPPLILLLPIGKVETRGLEFDSRLRATENLSLNFGGAWINAKIKDYPNGACWEGDRQTATQGCIRNPDRGTADPGFQTNLAGNRMPNAPEFKLFAAANYFVPLDNLPFDMELGTSWRWQSETWFDFRGNPELVQGSHGVLNLSASLLDREGRYSLSLFVNNLLDKHFYNRIRDDANWRAPASDGQRYGGYAHHGRFARDSFRYAGVRLRVNF